MKTKIPKIEFSVLDVARLNKISHTNASYLIYGWYKSGLIKQASTQTWSVK